MKEGPVLAPSSPGNPQWAVTSQMKYLPWGSPQSPEREPTGFSRSDAEEAVFKTREFSDARDLLRA